MPDPPPGRVKPVAPSEHVQHGLWPGSGERVPLDAAAQEEVAFGSPRCTAAKLFLKLAKVESSQKVSPKAFQILTLLRLCRHRCSQVN